MLAKRRRIFSGRGLSDESVVTKVEQSSCNPCGGKSAKTTDCCPETPDNQIPINLTVNVNSNNTDSIDAPYEQNLQPPVFQPFVNPTNIIPPGQDIYNQYFPGGNSSGQTDSTAQYKKTIMKDGMRNKPKKLCKEVFYVEFP